jgi:uncharacterized protein YceK
MRRIFLPLPGLLPLVLVLTGCGTVSRLTAPLGQAATALFTNATLADLQMTGVKSGPLIPLHAGAASFPGAEIQQELAGVLGQAPLGVLLPISRVGETAPWWVFCPVGELQAICEEIPPNAQVTFSGRLLGHGAVLLPTRLSWSAR